MTAWRRTRIPFPNFASIESEFSLEVAMHLDRDYPRSAIQDGKAQAMQRRVRIHRRAVLKDLLEADVDDVPESGRARGALGEIQEVGIKCIVTGRRRIDRAAAFEYAGGILGIK